MSFSPEYADLDPSNPLNYASSHDIYQIWMCTNGKRFLIREEGCLEESRKYVLNASEIASEIYVKRVDLDTGDDEIVMSAEYDDGLMRYVESK